MMARNRKGTFAAALMGPLMLVAASSGSAQPVAEFYHGKTITIIVGFGAGGGFDLYARLVGDHLGRHLPGKPRLIVQNMPGAGSVKAANYVYNAAPKNGTVLGTFLNTIPLNRLLDPAQNKYETEKFNWIGRVDDAALIGLVWHTAPAKSVEDARTHQVVLAATGAASMDAVVPYMLNLVLGTKFKVVQGYKSSAAAALAVESGETHGLGATSWQVLQARKPEWTRENKIRLLYVADLTRHKAFPDTPTIVELARTQEDREVLSLIARTSAVGRAYAATPGVPMERVAALRRAFEAMLKDRAFVADAARRKLDLNPLSGEDLAKVVAQFATMPQSVIDRARIVTRPPAR